MAVTVDVISQLDEQALADAATRIRHTIREAVRSGIREGIEDALRDAPATVHIENFNNHKD